MEPNDNPEQQPRIIFVNLTKNDHTDMDPETIRWLTEFVEHMSSESFVFDNLDKTQPSLMDELEYLDSLIQGDEHPEAMKMIMDAYHNHKERNN